MARENNIWEAKWSPEDLNGLMHQIEFVKNQSIGSLASITELVEILELLHGMVPDFPLPQQRYFREAVDELVGLAVGHLEKFRTDFQFV